MLKVIVGVSRKVGLPGYSSVGASCQIEVELASGFLGEDLDAFHEQVRRAYAAAHQAVNNDLAPFQPKPRLQIHGASLRQDASRFQADSLQNLAKPVRSATPRQIRTISRMATQRQLDLADLLAPFEVGEMEKLSITQASDLINGLMSARAI
jgi:hypothetical protein